MLQKSKVQNRMIRIGQPSEQGGGEGADELPYSFNLNLNCATCDDHLRLIIIARGIIWFKTEVQCLVSYLRIIKEEDIRNLNFHTRVVYRSTHRPNSQYPIFYCA